MDERPAVIPPNAWIAVLVVCAVGIGIYAIVSHDSRATSGNRLPEEFKYQIDQYKKIDPAKIGYRETAEFPCDMTEPKAVAVGPDDRIHVAGDGTIEVFDEQGNPLRTIDLSGQATCLAVGGSDHAYPGRIYVGIDDHVELYSPEGDDLGGWTGLGPKAVLTSIALTGEDVFVADAGNFLVRRFDTSGELIGTIGSEDPGADEVGFIIPSPFFDVASHPDGGIRVINPGLLRIETYTRDGALGITWGEAGAELGKFFGCCNPANLAVLSDGRIVTAEKGLLRVKVYHPGGRLDTVVAGPEQLGAATALSGESLSDQEYTAVDVAVDSQDRIIVLDRPAGLVRVYEPRDAGTDEGKQT